jgi:sensor histidine kinase YesM
MNAPPRKGLVAWLKHLECRADAWAAKRLSAEEYAEAAALDVQLKRNIWRWLAYFLVVAGAIALLVKGIAPQVPFPSAYFYSAVGCLYVLAAFSSAWFGYRKFTRRPWWVVLAIFLALLVVGAIVGYIVGSLNSGRSLVDIDATRVTKAIAIAVGLGILLGTFLIGIAQLRLREANQKAARLEAEAERERLERQGVQAELKLLQAQVEPHFLFNTLANVRHLVQTQSPDALAMLDHLIHYLRTALPEIRGDSSTLGREAELARAYLEIMRLRMGGALELAIDVPTELARAPFPPLMLITLVENAIKHGVAPLGRGRVTITATQRDGRLRVEVSDDGPGLSAEPGQGVGLANVRDRLRALYGEGARLELAGREAAGVAASIEVPA